MTPATSVQLTWREGGGKEGREEGREGEGKKEEGRNGSAILVSPKSQHRPFAHFVLCV